MPEHSITGSPASPGVAAGAVWHLPGGHQVVPTRAVRDGQVDPAERPAECERALVALDMAAQALTSLARTLPEAEAEIVETGALMAEDPVLRAAVKTAIAERGVPAPEAILAVAEHQASAIEAIGDAHLAARADDVRSLGRRAAQLAEGQPAQVAGARWPEGDVILLGPELGPADVAELSGAISAIGLTGGSATTHAAIVARSLGIPMVTGLAAGALSIPAGTTVVLDGSRGEMIAHPEPERVRLARAAAAARAHAATVARARRGEPAVTQDGLRLTVLSNVASAEEVTLGIDAGSEGIGLLRTELAFQDALDWPDEAAHTQLLEPILACLGTAPAVVRVLDFGADKAPPFLRGVTQRGLELLLAYPRAFACQLRAILRLAGRRDLRILLPMVDTADQMRTTRQLLTQVAGSLGLAALPPLGAMVETPSAVQHAEQIAAESDFLSIGTNDLTATVLGLNRFTGNGGHTHDPRVLAAIACATSAAHEHGLRIEVCGEAASDPLMLPLLVGLGIDELSVGAARVGVVRTWIRSLNAGETAGLARSALTMDSAQEVAHTVRPMADELLAEAGDGGGESFDGTRGAVALGGQP